MYKLKERNEKTNTQKKQKTKNKSALENMQVIMIF